MAIEERVDIEYEGGTVATYPSDPDNSHTTLVMSHGLGTSASESERLLDLEARLNNIGIATTRMDLPGHGNSSKKVLEATLTDYRNAIRSVLMKESETHPDRKLGFYGTSVSTFAGLRAMEDPEVAMRTSYMVLLSPISDIGELVAKYLEVTGATPEQWESEGALPYPCPNGNQELLGFDFYLDAMENPTAYEGARSFNGETMMIRGYEDEVVPIDQVKKLQMEMGTDFNFYRHDADHGISSPKWNGDPKLNPAYLWSLNAVEKWMEEMTGNHKDLHGGIAPRINPRQNTSLKYYEP